MRLKQRVLCLDVSFCNTGVAVYCPAEGRFVHTECFTTVKEEGRVSENKILRCQNIVRRIKTLVERYNVTLLVAEIPHGGAKSSNAAAAMAMSTAIVACAVELLGIDFFPVTPTQVKRIVSPTGGAVDKDEVIAYARKRFGKQVPPYSSKLEHIADAMVSFEVYQKVK